MSDYWEKDAEIARLEAAWKAERDLANRIASRLFRERGAKQRAEAALAEKDAEIARLKAERNKSDRVANDAVWSKAHLEAALAESRMVTDAQRKRIAETLMHRVGVALAYEYADDIIAVLEEQPAAEGTP